MSERVRTGRKYPVMSGKKRARNVCRICRAGDAGCISFRRTGTCPVDKGFDYAEKIAKEGG